MSNFYFFIRYDLDNLQLGCIKVSVDIKTRCFWEKNQSLILTDLDHIGQRPQS